MTSTAYSGARRGKRVYVRRFDHDDAQRRYDAGEPIAEIAAGYGVTWQAVWNVVTPEGRATIQRSAASLRERTVGKGVCDDCGGPMNALSRKRGATRCPTCSALALTTTATATTLYCNGCREWKPDEDFPRDRRRIGRRGRHRTCRACNTRLRRDYRERHKVPCVGCGKPALPPNEKLSGGYHAPRCRECFYASRRQAESVLDHEERLARRRERYRRRVQAGAEDPAKPSRSAEGSDSR